MTLSIFGSSIAMKAAKEIRAQKVRDYQLRKKGGVIVPLENLSTAAVAGAEVVVEQAPIVKNLSIVPSMDGSVKDQATTTTTPVAAADGGFFDNLVNPEKYPDALSKPASSDEPTEDDDEESQDDLDDKDDEEQPVSEENVNGDDAMTTGSSTILNNSIGLVNGGATDVAVSSPLNGIVQNVLSEESKVVETIAPPNSIRGSLLPITEQMEKFVEEQRAKHNTGLLCGCF